MKTTLVSLGLALAMTSQVMAITIVTPPPPPPPPTKCAHSTKAHCCKMHVASSGVRQNIVSPPPPPTKTPCHKQVSLDEVANLAGVDLGTY